MVGNFCDGKLWDLNETWNSQVPQFSTCFEDLILTSSPCILFCLILFISLCLLSRQHSRISLPWTWLNISKVCLSVTLLIISGIWCGIAFYEAFSGETVPHSSLIASCSRAAVYLLITVTLIMHRCHGVITSDALSSLWLVFSLCGAVLYRSVFLNYSSWDSQPTSQAILILNLMYYPVIFVQLILSLFADKKKFSILQQGNVMDEVPLLMHASFLWFTNIIYKSRKKLLVVEDLSFSSVKVTAESAYAAFSKHWKYYLTQDRSKNPSLPWTLIRSFWSLLVLAIALELVFVVSLLLPPLLLDCIIDFTHHDFYTWRGYFFAVIIFAVDFMGKLVSNNSIHYLTCTSVQFQVALMAAIFRKNLVISTATRRAYNSGALMNLLSVDIKRIQWFTFQAVTLISAPLKIILIIVLMWQYLGISTLAGVGVICVLFPISYFVSKYGWTFSDQQMKTKDIRIKYMNEILSGIKILKLYAWEMPFANKVSDARKDEIKWIRYSLFCYVMTSFVYFSAPFLVSLASFGTFLMIDHNNILDPTRAFVSLTLIDQLRYALFELPDAIADFIQFQVSLDRLKEFFNSENTDPSVIGNDPDKGEVLTIKDATLSWSSESDWALRDINLHVPQGKLIAIIGPVGSGKTSLISGILGEMYKQSGSIDLKGSIAYVPQQPWVLNRSLKNNVLLVKHMDEDKYNKVLDLCCLRPDLDILPSGHDTEIGEKGVNLSGGQKLRVNLAQAVYQDREIYLLDDPLSAVDVHVRKSLFSDVIGNTGILRNKTRILVTHDVSVLHDVDLIVSMKDGCIDEIGTYDELMSNKASFTSFVEEHGTTRTVESKPPKVQRTLSRWLSRDSVISRGSRDSTISKEASGRGDQLLINEVEEDSVDTKVKTHRLIDDERMEIGGVHRKIYWNYVKRVGIILFLGAALFYSGYVSFVAGGNVWVSEWTSDPIINGTQNIPKTVWRLSIYGVFGVAQVFAIVLASFLLVWGSTRASATYHKDMLQSVMKSPMTFFDSTPMGRIINRFTTDLDILDLQLFYRLDGWLNCFFSTLGSFVIIGINTPIFLATLVPLGVVYYLLQKLHLHAFRQIKRLESTTRSPIYSLLMESIQGVSSISAYKIQKEFIQNFEEKLDLSFVCTFNSWTCNRWFNFGLDTLGSVIVFIATILAIDNRYTLSPAIVGLIITYALTVTDALKWFVRMNSELEDKSISIERVDEYCHLKPEAPWDLRLEELPDNWPHTGNIVFDGYSTKYREDLDLVLKDINVAVNANEKVGIIGRTGAGKSSVTLALFRIVEPVSGTIYIDNVNIAKIGLHDLRSNLTIIPQDPVLFTGTLRMNLDPNNKYTDDEIWEGLEKSYLKTFVSNLNEGLSYELEESGANLSAGQRQLLCLARALLKNTKILVLDEATASVDMDTDSLIQNTIRTAFANHTVITIAHRINTVLDYDKIIVMESGNVVEVGKPSELLQDPESRFYHMNKEAGLI